MKFDLPQDEPSIIKVIGVGGAGNNAVNYMYKQGIVGVDFAICNTDAQALEGSPIPTKIQLGPELTEGRGAGSKPNVGRQACIESLEEVKVFLEDNTRMLFVTAGMGGGTGTGAAPIIAKAAQEMDILTVGIVTTPFTFEGNTRNNHGREGLEELKKNVDTLIIISNDKLREIHGNMSMTDAFFQADNILATAAKGIAEIITVAGYVNVDFEDVNTVMRDSGVAIMGSATTDGDNRARKAVDEALSSPLLRDNDIRGAKHILVNIASGTKEVTMDEIFEITQFVEEEAGTGTNLIWGNCFDDALGEKLSVTVIATGFESKKNEKLADDKIDDKIVVSLDDDEVSFEGTYEIGHNAGEKAEVFEFENINFEQQAQKRKVVVGDTVMQEDKLNSIRESQRRDHNRKKMRTKLNPGVITELEKQPAYLRRKVSLDDVPHSSENQYSSWAVSNDDEPTLSTDNDFLHAKVD